MAPLVGPHDESYEDFYSNWLKEQERLMNRLQKAVEGDMKEPELLQELKNVAEHYELYYRAKKSASCQDILKTVCPEWRSSFEKAFLWLGGWRPSLAFQLVYALAGQQIEAELAEFLEGVDTPTLASLTSFQLSGISDLQTSTNKQEENLSNEMAELQQSFADQPLLTLAQAHHMLQTQSSQNGTSDDTRHGDDADHGSENEGEGDHDEEQQGQHNDDDSADMDATLQEKLALLQDIVIQADTLRLTTLQKVLDVLDTFQKAEYLIAAARLQAALRAVARKLDG